MERRSITIQGTVQGVGFRPYLYGLASRMNLGGWVRNDGGTVVLEVEGEEASLDRFLEELRVRPPPLAQITNLSTSPQPARGETTFSIARSGSHSTADVCISPDVAVCDDCLAELFDPTNRRYRYPFINCTNCGPRLTIITGAPYDRPRTTMASFQMCDSCRAEYEDRADRRFHAQPIACAACGPSLAILDGNGNPFAGDALSTVVVALREGRIVAIKGLGGFHLVCDARNEKAVRELRRRKQRDEKPFAVMSSDLASLHTLCDLDKLEISLLKSRARPILLAQKSEGYDLVDGVAPRGNPLVGVMLPYTPLHHLLLRELGEVVLVMTSGNRSDEPIAYEDHDAVRRLGGIADLFLTHNRPIHVRCDDSVTQVCGGRESPIRRSRGNTPQPLALPAECPEPILAVGAQLKDTFALGRGRQGILSHHLGDLDDLSAFEAFQRDIELYQQSFNVRPRLIAHDLHPDYASTRYAIRRRDAEGATCYPVQHHHAHMAACMAEHGLDELVTCVCFDGTGYGTDGAIWGGEFLVGDLCEFRRAGHLRYVPMPGGERAVKEPWRMAVAHLEDAGVDYPRQFADRMDQVALRVLRQAAARKLNAPMTSSVGRLFDAVASIIGIRDRVEFEGQAAMQLQWLAESAGTENVDPYPLEPSISAIGPDELGSLCIDSRPLIRGIVREIGSGVEPARIAVRFHKSLAYVIAQTCVRIRNEIGIDKVVLSGGVFTNSLLSEMSERELSARQFCLFRHHEVPTNDGGISYGQLAVIAKRLSRR